MKTWIVRCSSAVVIAALGCGFAPIASEASKKTVAQAGDPVAVVQAESDVVDVGEVTRGEEAKATFVLKNTSDRIVKVLNAKPGCGCTVASFDEKIPVGGTGKVSASVKTENFHGPIEKLVTVTTDDPANPNLILRIKANVVGSVTLVPRPGIALPAGANWEYEGKLIVRKDPTEQGALKISEVSSTAPWLVVKTREVTSQEPAAGGLPEALPGDWILDVSVGEDATKTQAGYVVKFKTGLPREPEVSVPVSVSLQNPMRVTPTALYLSPSSAPAKDATGSLSAVLRPGLSKEKVTATASPEAFSVRLEPDGGRRYKVIVRWKGESEGTPKDGSVVLKVGGETVTVPVHVSDGKSASLLPAAKP